MVNFSLPILLLCQDLGRHADIDPAVDFEVVKIQDAIVESKMLAGGPPSSQAEPGYWFAGPKDYNYQIFMPEEVSCAPGGSEILTLRYDKKQSVWVEDYPIPTVGMPTRRATREEMAKYVWGEPGDIGELADPNNFQIAEFLLQSKLSVSDREDFLKLSKVRMILHDVLGLC